MSIIKIFHAVKETPEVKLRINQQYKTIRNIVENISGCSKYIQLPEGKGGGVAFSGTNESPDLVLEIYSQKHDKKAQLYFNLFVADTEESWQEWDYDNIDLCSEQVAKRISSLMNHTVKFIKKQKKHTYIRTIEQVMDSSGNWQTISDEYTDSKLVRPFLIRDIDDEKIATFSFVS